MSNHVFVSKIVVAFCCKSMFGYVCVYTCNNVYVHGSMYVVGFVYVCNCLYVMLICVLIMNVRGKRGRL